MRVGMSAAEVAELLPDVPRWVEVRGMLLEDRARVLGLALFPTLAFTAVRPDTGDVGVVGIPSADSIHRALDLCENVRTILVSADSLPLISATLPDFSVEHATLHTLGSPDTLPSPNGNVRLLARGEIAELTHLPPDLQEELALADETGAEIAAAWQDVPVAFCYAGSVTEGLWDISIDTLKHYRRQGHATQCVAFQISRFRSAGKSPVWGSLDSNVASASLAAKLGFSPVDEIFVVTPPL